jgi:hypothetical protein
MQIFERKNTLAFFKNKKATNTLAYFQKGCENVLGRKHSKI